MSPQQHIPRRLTGHILSAHENSPVVFVNGPRQAGKSTLVQKLAAADYVTFDNAIQMAAATA
ncbi:MAG: hypothetical protein Tsb002_13710 [Wenzhouxiangellaceae bacterium]